jgi:hypothetical protein
MASSADTSSTVFVRNRLRFGMLSSCRKRGRLTSWLLFDFGRWLLGRFASRLLFGFTWWLLLAFVARLLAISEVDTATAFFCAATSGATAVVTRSWSAVAFALGTCGFCTRSGSCDRGSGGRVRGMAGWICADVLCLLGRLATQLLVEGRFTALWLSLASLPAAAEHDKTAAEQEANDTSTKECTEPP